MRKINKYESCCSDNSCIIFETAIFKNKIPAVIKKNLQKDWLFKKLEYVDVFNELPENVREEVTKLQERNVPLFYIYCDYEYSWTAANDFEKIKRGEKISGWLNSHPNHKDLVYGYSWNKID